MNDPELTETLASVQQALAALVERVARLEARLEASPECAEPAVAATQVVSDVAAPELAAPPTATQRPPASGEIAPDIVLAISAAVAAYLGERAHVRQVRLLSSSAWGQQGRVTVQASHALHR